MRGFSGGRNGKDNHKGVLNHSLRSPARHTAGEEEGEKIVDEVEPRKGG